MKSKFFGLAVVAMSLLASCSDDDIIANVTLPEEIIQTQTEGLESHSYSIPFEVKSDSEWKIEFDEAGDEIAYAHPASGKGNATINLYVLDNLNNESREGTMTVMFPADKSKNMVVTLKQKSKESSDDNFSADAVGNITYGVGYGFNVVTGVGARGIKSQIIKAQLLTEEKQVQKAATSTTSIDFQTYTGTTVKELSNNFSASSEFSGGGWGIEAEANAKFDMNNYSKDEYQYAMSFVDVTKEQITITLHEDEWLYWNELDEGCYTRAAYNAINGINRKYPSDKEGFKKLFDSYGTHVIRTATLGGRLTIATTINTSDISTEYNLEAFAKMSYSGVVDVSGEVNDTYKNSFNENSSACQTKISVLGGSSSIFSDLSDLVGDGAKNTANAWYESMNEDESTWTFIGLDDVNDLIPIWELVEDPERAEDMQEYFESGEYAEDTYKGVVYDMGVQAHLVSGAPEFEVTGTQIADVKIGEGNIKTVARICNEFIPELNEKEPVKVVYPVINGKVKWNMGWFVGNEIYAPRRVINMNGTIKTEVIRNEEETGEATEIFIRGVRIGSTPVDEETVSENATTEPYYEQLMRENTLSDYKVVKILDKIWITENYCGTATMKAGTSFPARYYTLSPEGHNTYAFYESSFGKDASKNKVLPDGWVFPNYESVNSIVKYLNEKGVQDVVQAFGVGGALRFNAFGTGFYNHVDAGQDVADYRDSSSFYMSLDYSDPKKRKAYYIDFVNKKLGETTIDSSKDNLKNKYIMLPFRTYKPIQ